MRSKAGGRNRILLTQSTDPEGVWYAEQRGPHAKEALDLFGTHVIPTAFRARMAAAEVLTAIRALNPGVDVQLN